MRDKTQMMKKNYYTTNISIFNKPAQSMNVKLVNYSALGYQCILRFHYGTPCSDVKLASGVNAYV
jgi:hypothetical protein